MNIKSLYKGFLFLTYFYSWYNFLLSFGGASYFLGMTLIAISIPIQTLIKQLVQSFYLWRNNSPVFSAELNLITGCIKTKAVGS